MCNFKSFAAIIAASTLFFMASSCSKNEPQKDYSFSAVVESVDSNSVTVSFEVGENIKAVKYTSGCGLNVDSDYVKFLNGASTGVTVIDPEDSTEFTITAQSGEPVAIFVRPIKDDDTEGDIVCLKTATGPVAYELSKTSLGSFVYSVPSDLGDYDAISIFTMIATAPGEWGMTVEEIADIYAWGYDPKYAGESSIVELNGEPEVEQYGVVIYWKPDFTYDKKIFSFTSGSVIPNAPEAELDVKVQEITKNSASIVFTPGEYTCAYYYKLYTKADYDATIAAAPSSYENPVLYVRDLAALGGSFKYQVQTDTRSPLEAGTTYVIAAFPFNVNGSKGWGKSIIKEFETLAE